MRTKPVRFLMATLAAAAMTLGATNLSAQSYSIDWFTIDGGGGTSSGGPYTLTGTIGQPDAGTMAGGNYVLQGGFWSIFAVQVPGAPTLLIVPAGLGMATISWAPNTPGFVLQMNDTVDNPAGWTDAPSGSANPTSVPSTAGQKFYRLRKP